MNNSQVNQLEFELENASAGSRPCPSVERRIQRQRRARYWFDRMRQVVDCAREWPAAPVPQFESAARQTKRDEQHLVE